MPAAPSSATGVHACLGATVSPPAAMSARASGAATATAPDGAFGCREVTRLLAEHGLYVSELAPIAVDLESVFLELTATAPVPGQHRQVDQSTKVGEPGQSGGTGGGWGA
jgi:ABC-2 type transport system ATP-binding protein